MELFVEIEHHSTDPLLYQSHICNWKEITRRRMKYVYTDLFNICEFSFPVVCYPACLHIHVYSVFTFIALQCIVDGPDLRLCRFSITRWTQPARSSRSLSLGVSRPFHAAAGIAWLSKLGESREGQQSLDCNDGRWSALSILCNREIDAKHCRLRKVDGRLGQHEIAGGASPTCEIVGRYFGEYASLPASCVTLNY